jgi:hypothetical protein
VAFYQSGNCRTAAFILSLAAIGVNGQTHFTFTSQTGNNMTVIVRTAVNPIINGQPLAGGDEIGVFTPAGLCVGARTWDSVSNRAITVWGDNDMTPDTSGMFAGETLSYRIWESSLALELPAAATYDTAAPATSRGTYTVNGISILATLFAPSLPLRPVQISPPDTALIIDADSIEFIWNTTLPAVDRYVLEIATDSLMTVIAFADSVTDTTFMRHGLAIGTSYWWRVRAHNGSGWGGWSDTLKFTLASTAVTLPQRYSMNFHGLTASGPSVVRYALPAPSQVSIRIYTLQGKLTAILLESYQETGNHQVPVNLSALSKGFYLLSFSAGKYTVRKELINY